jgi:hypothetical protein
VLLLLPCQVCAIKMCRVVPYAAAGELVHALADARGTFLVGEQGQIRIQVQVQVQDSLLPHTRLAQKSIDQAEKSAASFVSSFVPS